MSLDTFIVFSGTSIENYRTCAISNNHIIYFDKSKEPKHFLKEVYFERTLVRAIAQSIHHAMKLGHYPLVLEGGINLLYRGFFWMFEGDWFPVDKVWVPKLSLRFSKLDLGPFWNKEADPKEYYEPINPRKFLK